MNIKARFVVPVDAPVIENGSISIQEGRIREFAEPGATLAGKTIDYGDAVILPGFVNAHTHLELSLLAGRVPPSLDFVDWLQRLMTTRSADMQLVQTSQERQPSTDPVEAHYVARAVRRGVAESLASGVTTVGDITAFPALSRQTLSDCPLRVVSFGEVIAIGAGRTGFDDRIAAAINSDLASLSLRIGLSPHAPYSVDPDLLKACGDLATQRLLPLCIHVAETQEEHEFTQNRSGPLCEFIRRLGIFEAAVPASKCSPVAWCDAAGILTPRTILAHANYVSDADIGAIASCGASVAFCPRTHHAFGHAPHRFLEMIRAGINVCIGTDSLASNPSLSILDEMRFLRSEHPDIPQSVLLQMATLAGARALGLAEVCGSITPGKSADLVVLPLVPSARREWSAVFESKCAPLAVYAAGVRRSSSAVC